MAAGNIIVWNKANSVKNALSLVFELISFFLVIFISVWAGGESMGWSIALRSFLILIIMAFILIMMSIGINKVAKKVGTKNVVSTTVLPPMVDHNIITQIVEMSLVNSKIYYTKSTKGSPSAKRNAHQDIYDILQLNCTIQVSTFAPHRSELRIGSRINHNEQAVEYLRRVIDLGLSQNFFTQSTVS